MPFRPRSLPDGALAPRNIIMHTDIMFVNMHAFLITVAEPIALTLLISVARLVVDPYQSSEPHSIVK